MTGDDRLLAMLGYLNFSDGTPSPAFARNLDAYYRSLAQAGESRPWDRLLSDLRTAAVSVDHAVAAFHDTRQADAVASLAADFVLPAYREHHRDLLSHLRDDELYQPFFLVRVFEVILSTHDASDDRRCAARLAIDRLNDFVGHRPMATLEHEPSRQPYDHERVRPIPVYLRGVGVGYGRYERLLAGTLEILTIADPPILFEAAFDPDMLDELALDPRAYDFGHPLDHRPGYQFGEWDPHVIDNAGRYHRFVLHREILEALWEWLERESNGSAADSDQLFDASAALAGTMLLASGISGSGPASHGSDVTLGTLVPRIAACRDRFYASLLATASGSRADRLRQTAQRFQQPFGDVRQYLNRYLTRRKAEQRLRHHLARMYARIGYIDASRSEAQHIPTTRVRMQCELENLLVNGHQYAEQGQLSAATELLSRFDEVLERAIHCGAIVDPWNILGFQGQFPLFSAMEDSIVDGRIDELLQLIERLFHLYALVLREAAARGDQSARRILSDRLEKFADSWDRYATHTVSGVRRVCGRELAASALFVAEALAQWQSAGATAGDVAFWRRRGSRLDSPQAVALVVDALLEKRDLRASLALLMHWLSRSESIPLEENRFSFFQTALRWMRTVVHSVLRALDTDAADDGRALVKRFFELLEANAESYWHGPALDIESRDPQAPTDDVRPFAAAYEGMTYRDSAADGVDGDLLGESAFEAAQGIAAAADSFRTHLRFFAALARLWQLAIGALPPTIGAGVWREVVETWAGQAARNRRRLLTWIEAVERLHFKKPTESHESIVEYDRYERIRGQLIHDAIAAAIETSHFLCRIAERAPSVATSALDDWERRVVSIRQNLPVHDLDTVRKELAELQTQLGRTKLLYTPLELGGRADDLYRTRYLREALRRLAGYLPRHGAFRETYRLLETVAEAEENQAGGPYQVSEFGQLFQTAHLAVMETLTEALARDSRTRGKDDVIAGIVGSFVGRFARLWVRHAAGVRVSYLEKRSRRQEWDATTHFVRRYGRELFTQKFMTLGNLRGILQSGAARFLEQYRRSQDAMEAGRLADDLESGRLQLEEAAAHLEFVIQAILENYEIYKDYNATTAQSDYGENLHVLLVLLRLKTAYDRHRWTLEPAYTAHRILARRGLTGAAELLQRALADETASVAQSLLEQLHDAQTRLGIYLGSIEDLLEERFVRPLQVDRILTRVEALVNAANGESGSTVIAAFRHDVERLVRASAGTGQYLPSWLGDLELEVVRVHAARSQSADFRDEHETVVGVPISLEEIQKELNDW
jgi:hypothetical protein